MRGDEPRSAILHQLETLDQRLRAAERDAVLALWAIGAIMTVLTLIGGGGATP